MYHEQQRDRHDLAMAQAWHTARWVINHKVPKLESVLSTTIVTRSPAAHKHALLELSAQYGIPMRKTRLRRKPSQAVHG